MKSSDYAWMTLGAGVLGYDILCGEGLTLSERVDDWLTTHPVATRAAVIILAAHLINAVPERVDIVHQGFIVLRLATKVRRRTVVVMDASRSVPAPA